VSDPTRHPGPHLTPALVERWTARFLGAAEALAVSDHLASCPDCRSAVSDAAREAVVAATVDRQLDEALATAEHLSSDQLERCVDGTAESIEAELMRSHLEHCASCRDEVRDLAAFAAAVTSARARRQLPAWGVGLLTAAAAILLLLALHQKRDQPETAPAPTSAPTRGPASASASPALPPMPTTILRDGGREIRVAANGAVEGLPEPWGDEVATVLRRGVLALPEAALLLLRAPDPERSPGAEDPTAGDGSMIEVEEPLSVVVLDDRPVFRWRGPAEATYELEVFDPAFNRIAASGPLRAHAWRPSAALPRGQQLTWKLTTTDPDGQRTAYPRTPAAPAVFQIADAATARSVAAARATGSHLIAGLALWKAGRAEDAARELALFAQQNPQSVVARRLARSSAQGASRLRTARLAQR
jgi:hypothetical protein